MASLGKDNTKDNAEALSAQRDAEKRQTPRGVSDVWQTKNLQTTILEVWQIKDLRANSRICGK